MTMQLGSLTHGLAKLFGHFPARRRWQALVVLGLMLVGAVAEVLTIGAVLPFLAIIARPEAAATIPGIGWLMATFGLEPGRSLLTALAALFCLVAITAAGLRIALAWASQKFVYRLGYDLGVAVYRRILHQPYAYHVSHNSSEVIAGMSKVQQVITSVLMPLMQGLSAALIALFIFAGLLLIDAGVAIASGLGFGLIYLLVSTLTRSRLRANSKVIARMQTLRIQTIQEGMGGIRDVLLDHAQPIYLRKFAAIDTQLRDRQAANALIGATPRFVVEAAGMVLIVLLALVLSGQPGGLMVALPTLGALALGAQRMLPLLQLIYNGWTQLVGSHAAFGDILALLDAESAPPLDEDKSLARLPFADRLSLDKVRFRYLADGPWVLDGVSIDIPRGSRVGFIGKTGSGKSTAMDLAMGLLQPTRGVIRVDGTPLTPATIGAWQRQIAHVPQHIYLSDATILENIAFGTPLAEIDLARAEDAARRADIHAFIDEQPEGYETMVGERGVRLSGGQRQRIGIARALYKRSTLLVFDEATSALDDATETSVMQSIDSLGRDLTVLLIAHRLTTLRNCDIIYRLDRGRVIECGSYEEIIAGRPVALAG